MKKKIVYKSKAFTLVELLATIAIIGLVTTTIIVSINKFMESTKDNSAKITIANIRTSARAYATEYSLAWGNDKTDGNTYTCISIQELINYGYFKQSDFPADSSLYEYYKITKNISKTITNIEKVSTDTDISSCDLVARNILDAPKITSGSSNEGAYTDTIKIVFANSTRSRNGEIVENDITNVEYSCKLEETDYSINNIVNNECSFTGLNHNTKYSYQICASEGENGQKNCTNGEIKTKELKNTTIVENKVNLTVKLTYNTEGIYSTNNVKRYFKFDKDVVIDKEVYSCGNSTPTSNTTCDESATNTIEGNNWYLINDNESTITITNNVTIDTIFSDGTNTISNSKEIKLIPPTKPIITGGSSTWSKINKTITISTKSTSEAGISNYEYYLSTSSSTQTGGSWISFGTNTSFNVEKEGTYYVFVRAKDNNELYSDVSNYQTVKIDKKVPTCSSVSGASTSYAYGSRTITVYCSDTLSGCKQSSYSKTFTATTSNITTGTITIYDNANNSTNCTVNVYLKPSPPTTPTITGGSSTWSKVNKTITISTKSSSTVGISNYEYYISNYSYTQSGGSWTNLGTSSSFSISTVGTHYVFVRAKDKNGQYSAVSNYQTVKIDKTAPTCGSTYGEGSPYNVISGSRTITTYCSDSLSGCKQNSYQRTWRNGDYTIGYIYIYDNAGNYRSCPVGVYLTSFLPYTPMISEANSGTSSDNCVVTSSLWCDNNDPYYTGNRNCYMSIEALSKGRGHSFGESCYNYKISLPSSVSNAYSSYDRMTEQYNRFGRLIGGTSWSGYYAYYETLNMKLPSECRVSGGCPGSDKSYYRINYNNGKTSGTLIFNVDFRNDFQNDDDICN